ncbi:MAG: hypothetical protein J5675_05055 [Bacteroidales bacterium]|nr:hypothetical protein [Bacteroidales bacterium]
MKCARHIARIVMLVAMCVAAASCGVSKIKDIKVNSFDVKYVTPTSARSLDAVLLLGINNPAMNLVISGLEGTVKYNDKAIAVVSAGTIPLEKKTDKVYEIPCTASLVDGVSLLSLFPLLANPDPKGLNVDVHLRVANKKGIGTDLVFNDLSIAKFTR